MQFPNLRLTLAPICGFAALLGLQPAAIAQRAEPPAAVAVVGSFSNMRYTEEHAYGYSVELWRHGNSLIGLFLASDGPPGDTPTGLIENVEFRPKTGSFTFQARLTTGVVYSKEHDGVPSRDLFRFTGFLKGSRLSGRLERYDLLNPHAAPVTEQVTLRREKPASDMTTFKNFSEWKEAADEILKFRGPK